MKWALNSKRDNMKSSNRIIIAAVLVFAAVCVFGVFYAMADDEDGDYAITYVLNGGTNSDLNLSSYQAGDTVTLYDPISDSMYFYSWYLDENFETECTEITSDMRGDITLYAKWVDNLEGKGIIFNLSGSTKTGFFTEYELSGTETYMYLYYDEESESYFMSNTSEYIYTSGFLVQTKTYENSYWSGESDITWTYIGEKTIDTIYGEKVCEVWQGTDAGGSSVQTQYIADGWIPYLMTYTSTSTWSETSVTYTYAGDFTFTTSSEYSVQVYCDTGITVSGSGTYSPGDTATLTASVEDGTTFLGWYDAAGNLLSSNLTYETEIVAADVTLYALNTSDPDFTYDSGSEIELNSGLDINNAEWQIINSAGETVAELSGASPSYTFSTAGEYTIYISGECGGSEYLGYYTAVVTGDIVLNYEWSFENTSYTYELTIDYADLVYYRNLYSAAERQQGSISHDLSFVTSDDAYVVKLASDFSEMTEGMNSLQTAGFLLAFIQSLDYQSDSIYMGYEEYWKFPLETLCDYGGDCEDTSILYCAIADAMGYDTALLLFPGHMAAGISVEGCDGYGFVVNNVAYYFCETTSEGYDVGDNPSSMVYNERTVTFIAV